MLGLWHLIGVVGSATTKPHLVHVVIDDLGYNDPNFRKLLIFFSAKFVFVYCNFSWKSAFHVLINHEYST